MSTSARRSCGCCRAAGRWPGPTSARLPVRAGVLRRRHLALPGRLRAARRRGRRVSSSARWPGRPARAAGSRSRAFSAYFAVRLPGGRRPLRRRHRRQPRADRGPQPRGRREPTSTCGPPASRRGSCGCWRPRPGCAVRGLWSVAPGRLRGPPARPRPPGIASGRGTEPGSTMQCHLSRWLRNSSADPRYDGAGARPERRQRVHVRQPTETTSAAVCTPSPRDGHLRRGGRVHAAPGGRRRPRRHVPRGRHRRHHRRVRRRRHRQGHGRQGRQGRGPARHRLQVRGRHPGPRAVHPPRRRPPRDRQPWATRSRRSSSRRRTRRAG